MNRWVAGLFAVLSLAVNAAAGETSSEYGAFLVATNRSTVLLLVVAAVLLVLYLMRRHRRIARKT